MKVRFIDQFQKNSVAIYLFDRLTEAQIHDSKIAIVKDDGTIEFVGAEEKPTFRHAFESPVSLTPTVELPIPVVEEIVKWYRQTYPTRHADDAIRDAREVRDRLLTLVEVSTLDRLKSTGGAAVALKELRK